jgi:GntR family transcriptional regulator
MATSGVVTTTGQRRALYLQIVEHLHGLLNEVDGKPPVRLPTEADLTRRFGVSRQTVRRAYAELVSEGAIQRTAGRGTFSSGSHRFLISVGSLDDLLAQRSDRTLTLVTPITLIRNDVAATKLGLPGDHVGVVACQLIHEGRPFALMTSHLPPRIVELLADIEFLHNINATGQETVLSIVDRKLGHQITMAKQAIHAVAAPPDVAPVIDCQVHQPILKIELLYFDNDGRPVQLNTNFYNPERYEYRAHLQRRSNSVASPM